MNMEGIIYLTLDQAIVIHKKTIQYSGGGTYEHFDLGRLESVLQNIQNDDYYPTFEEKLTHLFYCTCEFHCFADGNKRLAITLCASFFFSMAIWLQQRASLLRWRISATMLQQEKSGKNCFCVL